MTGRVIARRAVVAAMFLLGLAAWMCALTGTDAQRGGAGVYLFQLDQSAPLARNPAPAAGERYALVREGRDRVLAPLLGRETDLPVLEVLGDSHLLFPAHPLLQGRYPAPGSAECLLDQATAEQLWGDQNAAGQTLEHGDQSYTVTGVLALRRPLLLLAVDAGESFLPHYGAYSPGASWTWPAGNPSCAFSPCSPAGCC